MLMKKYQATETTPLTEFRLISLNEKTKYYSCTRARWKLYILLLIGCYDYEVHEGHIVLIAPRSLPTEDSLMSETSESLEMVERGCQSSGGDDPVTWQTVGEDLDERKWGSGPILKEEAINDVSGFPAGLGCCDCKSRCSCCASFLAFPRHTTANQFFTPRLFTVYHREGYRACMECDDFLTPPTKSFQHPKLTIHV